MHFVQLTSKPVEVADLQVKCRVAESKAYPAGETIWPDDNIFGDFVAEPAISVVAESKSDDGSATQKGVCASTYQPSASSAYPHTP